MRPSAWLLGSGVSGMPGLLIPCVHRCVLGGSAASVTAVECVKAEKAKTGTN